MTIEIDQKSARPPRVPEAAGIQVIARAVDILQALKQDNSGLSLGQIAERLDLPRSTVQRIINALIAERLVMSTSAKGGGLKLGPEIQSLAAAGRVDVAELVRPILVRLAADTGETVDLAVLRDDHMVFVDQVVGTQRLRTVSGVGERFPLMDTANGKAALSLLPGQALETLIALALNGTGDAGKSTAKVLAEVEDIRRRGVAFDIDEHTVGISAIGAAFTAPQGEIYALSIPVPSQRFAERSETLEPLLRSAIDVIEVTLGG